MTDQTQPEDDENKQPARSIPEDEELSEGELSDVSGGLIDPADIPSRPLTVQFVGNPKLNSK